MIDINDLDEESPNDPESIEALVKTMTDPPETPVGDLFSMLVEYGKVDESSSTQDKSKRTPQVAQKSSGNRFIKNMDPRFFYRPSEDPSYVAKKRKREFSNRTKVIPQNKDSIAREESYAKDLPKIIEKDLEKVREYFLKDLAPKYFAAQAGIDQAKQVLSRVLDSEVDPTQFGQFDVLLKKSLSQSMARFIQTYVGLSEKDMDSILEKPKRPSKEVIVIPTTKTGTDK